MTFSVQLRFSEIRWYLDAVYSYSPIEHQQEIATFFWENNIEDLGRVLRPALHRGPNAQALDSGRAAERL